MSKPASDASPLRVLLIEDNPAHAELFGQFLRGARDRQVDLTCAASLDEGLELIDQGAADVVFVNLILPDSDADQTVARALDAAVEVPLIVLSSLDDRETAVDAVRRGAQDCLVKSQINTDMLHQSIRYSVERKRSELQCYRFAEELERSNRELESFAHIASHELRTPLWVLSYAIDMLNEQCRSELDEKGLKILDGARDAAGRLSEVIDSMLTYARAAGNHKPAQPTDSHQAMQAVLTALQGAITSNQAQVTMGPLPMVMADATQLIQVFRNLIDNALKYRRQEPPRIHVEAHRLPSDWQFCVRDNGVGFDVAFADQVFAMFKRLHQSSRIPGTGIGLATCKRIVERHGGRMWVESRPDEGSAFYFTLPHPRNGDTQPELFAPGDSADGS